MAKRWLADCLSYHPSCSRRYASCWTPTRLVDISDLDGSGDVQLVITDQDTPNQPYVTLSHCWGLYPQVRLLESNVEEFKKRVPLSILSKTFVDAIMFTRKLGHRFIWIDSLCIVQDSVEDWESESALMSLIYGRAICTIAASHATDGRGGCEASRDPLSIWPCVIPSPFQSDPDRKDTFYRVHAEDIEERWQHNVKDGPLYQRGWVLQERFLSPRTLYFGYEQLLWGCSTMEACESFPFNPIPEYDCPYNFRGDRRDFVDSFSSQHEPRAIRPFWVRWAKIVELYTSAKLAKRSDKLIALSGLATELQQHKSVKYLSGLWMDDGLPWALCWYRECGVPQSAPLDGSGEPSWSWASLDGKIGTYSNQNGDPLVTLDHIQANDDAISADKSQYRGTVLYLRGTLKLAYFDANDSSNHLHFRPRSQEQSLKLTHDLIFEKTSSDKLFFDTNSRDENPASGANFDFDDDRPEGNWMFCLPLVNHFPHRKGPVSTLVLKPVKGPPSHFRRIGIFSGWDNWIAGTEEMVIGLV
ncbi:HET-domain-containing protein [Aulographum hederae CBS 113979]|uniref:HET-domain-containing protein n=1 Tax=Aulographum hederae CBS 113979 TaxID=1176131 RepID=A0A6G1GM57_9PEZI|nr:HET-domain-containing protein [Aulographum hederae CBS 113979]